MDRIISNALSRYMTVFVKNWSKNALSLSILKHEGTLSDLHLNELVLQEILDVPMLKVVSAKLNELKVRLPSLTKLKSDPVQLIIDRFEITLEEPVEPIQLDTIFRDFMNGMKKSKKKTKYGFSDKIIDGLTFKINTVEVKVKPLGWFPSNDIGPWTPPYLKMTMSNFSLETTNKMWRVVSLRESLPKFDKKVKSFHVHRKGVVGNLRVELMHDPIDAESGHSYLEGWQPTHVVLLDKISSQMKLTQKKAMLGGASLGVHCEMTLEQCNVKWEQKHLGALIQWVSAMVSASTRPSLIEPYKEMKEELRRRAANPLGGSNGSSGNGSTFTSNTATATARGSGNRMKSSALKYVNPASPELEDYGTSTLHDYSESEVSYSDDDDLSDWESVTMDSSGKPVLKSDLSSNAPVSTPRIVFTLLMDEFFVQILDNKRENPREYVYEMLGFEFSFLKPEDLDEKHVQIKIPFIHMSERSIVELNKKTTMTELEVNRLLAIEEFSSLFSPRYKYMEEEDQYTIDLPVWPEFQSTHRYYPDQKQTHNTYKPLEAKKRRFFNDGKEMVRMRLVAAPDSIVFENRVNPIQIMLNVPKILQIVDFIFESIPDMDMEPPSKIEMPHYTKKSPEATSAEGEAAAATDAAQKPPATFLETLESAAHNNSFEELPLTDEEEEEMEKSVSFLIELRAPCLLIPSNSATGEYDDVSELLRLSTKEVIISSDPLLKKQKWTEDPESLYNTKSYPSHDDDHTRNSHALFDLARKFKFQISDFCMELLPSLSSQGQPFMDPISLDVHLGVNDNTLSPFHAQLPRLVVMSRIPDINLNLNQNQSILLLELWKTYAENPPQLTSLFMQHTKSVVSTGIRVRDNRKDKVLKVETKMEKGLMSTFFIARLEKVTLTLSSAEKNVGSVFDALSSAGGDALTELVVNGTEFIVESHSTSRQLIVKNRIHSISVLSPPASDRASTISLATYGFESPYVFANDNSLDGTFRYLVQARYEHPLHALLNKETLTVRGGPENNPDILSPQHSFNMNPLLRLKVEGLHLGMNVQSAFQFVKFLESKDNIFESSPLEVMTSTMKRTYTIMREKYLPKKSKKSVSPEVSPILAESGNDEMPVVTSHALEEQSQQDENIAPERPLESSAEPADVVSNEAPESGEQEQQSDAKEEQIDESSVHETNALTINTELPTDSAPADSPHLAEERPEHNDLSITELRKLRAVGKKLHTTLQTQPKVLYPLIWDVTLRHCELYIIEDELKAAAVGFSVERTRVVHQPIETTWNSEESLLRQYSIFGYEFEMDVAAENIQPNTVVPRPPSMETEETDTSLLIKMMLGDSFALKVVFSGSYSKPFTQRALKFVLTPHSESITFNMSPAVFYTSSKILRQQVASLKEFQHLLKFLKKPTGDIAFNFERLRSNISQTQISITRALLCHSSLSEAFTELNQELAEKEEALQSTISDKMRLTQMLADMQMQEFSGKVTTGAGASSKKATTEESVVLMECICAVLPHNQKEWKKIYAILIDNEILCLNQKVTDRTEMFNMKHRFAQIAVSRFAQVSNIKTTVGKSKQVQNVIRIENPKDQESLLLFTTNEKHMADWSRILEQCIEEDKLQYDIEERKKLRQEVEVQTEESSLAETEEKKVPPSDSHLKELKDLSLQLTIIKNSLGVARTDELILRERLTELSKYVAFFEKEQERRQEQVKVNIAREAERIKQLETQQIINKRLQIECKRRQKHIELIQKKHDEKVKLVQRTQEEKVMLQNNFRDYLAQADKEMSALRQSNERLSHQLHAVQQKAHDTQREEKMKAVYEDMLTKLQMQVAAQESRILELKQENIELRSTSHVSDVKEPTAPQQLGEAGTAHDLTPLSPPDKETQKFFTMSDEEIAPHLAKKLTRDSSASVFNTSPRHLVDIDMDFVAATPLSPLSQHQHHKHESHQQQSNEPQTATQRKLPPPPPRRTQSSSDAEHHHHGHHHHGHHHQHPHHHHSHSMGHQPPVLPSPPRPSSSSGGIKVSKGFLSGFKVQRGNLVQGLKEKSLQAINAIDAKANEAVAKLDELERKRKVSKHQKTVSNSSNGSGEDASAFVDESSSTTTTDSTTTPQQSALTSKPADGDLISFDDF